MKKLLLLMVLFVSAIATHAQSKVWQALWSEDNTTLYFAYSATNYAAGSSYTPESGGGAVTLTNVWSGATNGGISNRSWNSTVRSKVTTIVFEPSFKNFSPDYAHYWFSGCSVLKTVVGMENLKTNNLERMDEMFSGCTALESIDMHGKNTDNVSTVQAMLGPVSTILSSSTAPGKVPSMRR